ncbi:MAG: hypothetical protein ACJ76Z_00095 [Thermoleophilaceae bacterium]
MTQPDESQQEDPREGEARARRARLFEHLKQDQVGFVEGRGGCLVRCEVDPHTGAALIAVRDLERAQGYPGPEPADPFGVAALVLREWAKGIWAAGKVAPEHHAAAIELARKRWAERPDAADPSSL